MSTKLWADPYAMHPQSFFAQTSRSRDRRGLDLGLMVGAAMQAAPRSTPQHQLASLALTAFAPRVSWRAVVDTLNPEVASTARPVLDHFTRFSSRPAMDAERP
ncbi:MAG: hypothetical protein NTX29_07045, partial [Actinobacteria bacterium]|nr:hypothetical protein [Actinomycetota bacterium]